MVRSLAREYASYHSRSEACAGVSDKESQHEFHLMQRECGRIIVQIQDESAEVIDRFFDELPSAMSRYGVDWGNQ
jgi:hypothetical protein